MSQLIYTLGDPAGLGPELLFLADIRSVLKDHSLLIVGPESPLRFHCRSFRRSQFWTRLDPEALAPERPPGIYLVEPPGIAADNFQPGKGDALGGLAAGLSLELACRLMQAGRARALVTGPLNKAFMLEAGFRYGGHTEFLADFFEVDPEQVCMHLCGQKLRVSLVTVHPSLRRVPDLISREKIRLCLRLTSKFMARLGLGAPIAVCGLNPHAGEQGRIGHEEASVIIPAIEMARAEGVNVQGPFPADTVFLRAFRGEFCAVLAMYHDQGLGPLKLVEFGNCVNTTLGLPIIRTSVDHGTGYDLVGTGKASPASLERAMALAVMLGS